jgi:hypothetical protein
MEHAIFVEITLAGSSTQPALNSKIAPENGGDELSFGLNDRPGNSPGFCHNNR